MKIALVYDWLNTKIGGGETTFAEIAKLYPNADIHCLVYNEEKFGDFFNNREIRTSKLQKLPSFIKKRPQYMLPFVKRAVRGFDFASYDLVISVSSAWVKNIQIAGDTKHICYCYSPARMIWDSWPRYLETQKIGLFKIGPISKFLITKMVSNIRLWDFYSTDGVDGFIAISEHIKQRIEKFYRRESEVVYPPVAMGKAPLVAANKREYFLILSSLSRYKNIDIAIKACIEADRKLVVVGDGPDKQRLKDIARNNPKIVFTGRVDEDSKWRYHKNAKALIFPSIEDFGIAPVEAMSVGTPVIALRGGGLIETITDGVSGIFYDDIDGLVNILKDYKGSDFSPQKIRSLATKYATKKFQSDFKRAIDKLNKLGKYEKRK